MHPDTHLQLQRLQQAERDRHWRRLAEHPVPQRTRLSIRVAAHLRSRRLGQAPRRTPRRSPVALRRG